MGAGAYFALVFVGNVSQVIGGTSLFALDTDVERWGKLLLQPVLMVWALWCTRTVDRWPLRREAMPP